MKLIALLLFSLPVFSQTFRINAGGPSLTDPAGVAWSADQYGSAAYVTTETIPAGVSPIYSTKRYGLTFQYVIPALDGPYTVSLYMIDTTSTAAGQRVFSATINAAPALVAYDIVADAGVNVPTKKTFSVTAAGGKGITIAYTTALKSAMVNAIEVLPVAGPWIPPTATFANPPANPLNGQTFMFTDASIYLSCQQGAPGLTGNQMCTWQNGQWFSAAVPDEPTLFSAGAVGIAMQECASGVVNYNDPAALVATTPTVEILLYTTVGAARYDQLTVVVTTPFAGTDSTGAPLASLTFGIGRPGTNNSELTGAVIPLIPAPANPLFWSSRPSPPQISGGYTVVAALTVPTGHLLRELTAGALAWEVCGFRSPSTLLGTIPLAHNLVLVPSSNSLVLASVGNSPVALQWSYAGAAVSTTAGPSLVAARKQLTCNDSTCIAWGLNDDTIPNGIVATLASASPVGIRGALGADYLGGSLQINAPRVIAGRVR